MSIGSRSLNNLRGPWLCKIRPKPCASADRADFFGWGLVSAHTAPFAALHHGGKALRIKGLAYPGRCGAAWLADHGQPVYVKLSRTRPRYHVHGPAGHRAAGTGPRPRAPASRYGRGRPPNTNQGPGARHQLADHQLAIDQLAIDQLAVHQLAVHQLAIDQLAVHQLAGKKKARTRAGRKAGAGVLNGRASHVSRDMVSQ